MWSIRQWRRRRYLARTRVDDALWRAVCAPLRLLDGLTGEEQHRLRQLALLFLREKSIEPDSDLLLDERMRLTLAAQAALPILNLDIDWYEGWRSVIVYPARFIADREEIDRSGVVHRLRAPLSGEAWQRGPLVLAWSDIEMAGKLDGHNVIIHELAHKLDSLNGPADGFPPLHRDMPVEAWRDAFANAYASLGARIDQGEPTKIDPYAAHSPAEFFAVLSEAFFELPSLVHGEHPEVYRQLALFYRQDPLKRARAADKAHHYTRPRHRI